MTTSTERSTIIITILTLVSAILGFGRDAYIAYQYGASTATDEFYIASVIPDMAAQVISFALANAFIPILKTELLYSRRSATRLTSSVFCNAALFLVSMTAVTIWLRVPIIHLLAPGFSAPKLQGASQLLEIMGMSVIFCGLSGVLSGIHNTHEQFAYPALTGIVNNLLLIGTVASLGPWMGSKALAFAFSIGYFGRFVVQLVPLIKQRYLRISFFTWHRQMRKIIISLGPITICGGFESIVLIVDKILASQLPLGQITILNYAAKLGMLPYSLIGTSLATTLYTQFVRHKLDDNQPALRRLASIGAGWAVFFALLVAAGLCAYGSNIMSVLFKHGQFSSTDVLAAVRPLKLYGYFAISYLMPPILSRFFFSRQENWLVSAVTFVSLCLNIGGSIYLVHRLGISGLVLANAISQSVFTLSLSIALVRRLNWKLRDYARGAMALGFGPGMAFLCGALVVKLLWTMPPMLPALPDIPALPPLRLALYQGLVAFAAGSLLILAYAKMFRGNQIGRIALRASGVMFRWLH